MSSDASIRAPRAAIGLLLVVGLLFLLQIGALISTVLADTGGGAASTTITPDIASDQVAATAAEFRVDESGAATYSIPLYAVPGTAGVSPKLSLSYSSQGAYGPVGKGWSVSGLSSISRCRATREAGDFIVGGVATDGNPAPINFTATDRYCLDGQRLVPAQAGNAACPAVSGMTVQNLRTEIESFQRVCGYTPSSGTSGVAFFTVERKDGSISWYGNRDNNLTANRADGYFNSTVTSTSAFALSWAQTRFQDSTGNYIDFIYAAGGTGEHLISEVRYTGKTVLSGQTGSALSPYAKVIFNYSARSAAQTSVGYVAGGALLQSRRLDSITSCGSGAAGACATASQARFYQLIYATTVSGSGLDTLTSFQECRDSTKAVCLPATTFNWSQAKNEFATYEEPAITLGNWNSPFEGMKYGDVDGDGRQDMVYLLDGSSGGACPTESVYVGFSRLDSSNRLNLVNNWKRICTPAEEMTGRGDGSWHLLDYNGDGRDDLFIAGPTGTGWRVYPSLGDGNPNKIFDDTNNLIAGLSPAIPSVDTPEDQVQLADLNGDGLIDIVYPTVAGLRVRLMERQSGGFGWGSERQIQLDTSTTPLTDPKCSDPNYFCSIYFTGAPSPKTSFMQLADFNGDASSDLLMGVIEDVMYVGGNCTPQFAKGMVAAQPGERSTPYHFGKPASRSANRMLAQASCPPDKMHKSVHAMTVRSITSTVITVGSYANVVGDPATIMLADANGDGLTDLFYRLTSSTDWAFRINNGSGMFAESTFGPIPNADEAQIVDVNGDGRADMLYPYGSVFYAMYAQPAGGWAAGVPLPGAFACVGVCDAWYVNLFGDFDGDGGIDHISIRPGDTPNIFVSRATPATGQFKPRDVITSITNGLGAQTTISYAALTNEDLYRRDSGSRDTYNWGRGAPVQDLIASSYAVASVSSSSPQAGNPAAMATVRYRYAGAKVQAGGRGFLGFREIVTIDTNESGGYVTTTTSYNQQFPFVGMPTQTIKRAAIGQSYVVPTCLSTPGVESCFGASTVAFPTPAGNWFSDSTQIWEDDTEIAGTTTTAFVPGVQAPVHVRTAGTEEKLADPTNSAQTSRVLTTFGYGSYGNAISTTADTFTGVSATPTATVITGNVYTDTPTTWRLGRLTSTTVTHRRPNRADVVRTSTFAYATTTGLLNVEQVQPGGSTNQDLRKEYVLDVFGNRTTQETCAAPATSCSSTITFHPTGNTIQRYTRAAYDASGRYPLATYEPFWNGTGTVEKITQTVVARNLFGDVTQAYDLNGRDTLAVPGTFGRGYYNWAETVAGSIPGAPAGGVESTTTYRWCGTGTGQVSCPTGAKFRQKVATDGAPTQWTYFDVLGRPIMKAAESFNVAVSGKDVAATCTTYDATGKPKQVSNPFFLAGTAGADPSGLTSVCTTGRSWTTTSYDVLGRPVSVVAPDTSTVSNSYAGLTTTATDPRGNRTTQTRNGKGELTQVVDANGLAVTYWYLADGSMYLVQRDAGRGVIQNAFTYDALGRKIRQNDPDSGITDFEYNALGELTAQQSTEAGGKINRIENEIDARGRVWRRTVKQTVGTVTTVESISNYVFDTAANGIGQLASDSIAGQYLVWKQTAQAGTDLNYSRSYSYDTLGRSLGSTTGIDGVNYTAAVQYDSLGRPWKMQDVSGRWAKTVFNSRGMTESVCNSSAADAVVTCPLTVDTYLRTLETDAWGHTIKERRGNNAAMDVSRDYVANTGRIFSICAGTVDIQGHCALMTEMYAWDAAGNLSSQSKEARYVESFAYDSLNRLRIGTLTMQDGITANLLVQSFEYDALGNLCRRMNSGWATREYTYIGRSGCGLGDGKNSAYGGGGTGTLGPHQASTLVAGTDSLFYYYDSRGNSTIQDGATGGSDRTISYSLDDKAYEASLPTGVRTRFWYGSDGARYKREDGSKRTLYLGNVEIVTEGAVTTVKRTIAGVMLQTVVGATATNYYLFHDQLGSLVRITNATGAIVNNMDFLALGGRRNFDTQGANGTAPTLTTRGFTGHEMVDGLNIVHMNGRIYDTYVGRFLQPDPVIQAPDNTQSWNAYTYCLNNPLTYTDPTGAMSQSVRQGLAIIIGIVAACFGQYYITHQMFAMAFAVAAAGGFVAGAIASQSLKGGLQGAFAAVVSMGIGVGVAQEYQLLAQAASGGIMESLQGGNFGHGFLVAGLTTAFMPQVGKIGNSVVRTAVGAIVGGTISDATGGKFANGALSGAIQAAMASGGTNSESDSSLTAEQQASFAEQTAYNRDTALAWEPTEDMRMIGGFIRDEGLNVLGRTLDVVGGAGQVVLGGVTCVGVVTCVGGGALAAQGASNIYEGWTGKQSVLRQGYRKVFGQYGDMAYSAVDIGTSAYGLARPVLKPGSWKLFRYTSDQYIPAARTLTGTEAAIEAAGAANDAASMYRSHRP